jgi:DNA-binding transcriptional LysR family regulator
LAAPAYLARRGRPRHPLHLAEHVCLAYAYQATPDVWRFTNAQGEVASVRPQGPLRANNGDAMLPALIAGLGLGVLPDFIAGEAIRDGRLEPVLGEWSLPSGALHWVTPPGGPRPRRVEALGEFLAKRLSIRGP